MDMYQKRKMRAEKKSKQDDSKVFPSVSINWYPGHMAKTKREIQSYMKIIDMVFEIIDARIPNSSRIEDIDNIVKNKPRIILLSKSDLCDKNETSKWVKKYEDMGSKVLLVNLENQSDYKKIIDSVNEISKSINESRLLKGLKEKELKALVVGIPNVGKSTFINHMAGKKVANTGNKPGVTTNLVWLKTNSNILLLDTPGILWPKFQNDEVALNLASMSAIKSDILDVDEVACHILKKLNDYYPNIIMERYGINNIDDFIEVYETIGNRIGAKVKGGEIDFERVSNYILNDIKNEYVKNITFDRI